MGEKIKDALPSDLCYAVIDVETTGFSFTNERITEVAAVSIECGKILERFSTLINPGVSIPQEITGLTGITDRMVKRSPRFEEAAPGLIDFLGERILVAHNSAFDLGFLNAELQRSHRPCLSNSVLCTVRLARSLLPGLDNHKLGTVAAHYDIEILTQHRALGDAQATAKIFINLLGLAEEKGIREISQLMKLAGTRGRAGDDDE